MYEYFHIMLYIHIGVREGNIHVFIGGVIEAR